jgi:hypothetical protein
LSWQKWLRGKFCFVYSQLYVRWPTCILGHMLCVSESSLGMRMCVCRAVPQITPVHGSPQHRTSVLHKLFVRLNSTNMIAIISNNLHTRAHTRTDPRTHYERFRSATALIYKSHVRRISYSSDAIEHPSVQSTAELFTQPARLHGHH